MSTAPRPGAAPDPAPDAAADAIPEPAAGAHPGPKVEAAAPAAEAAAPEAEAAPPAAGAAAPEAEAAAPAAEAAAPEAEAAAPEAEAEAPPGPPAAPASVRRRRDPVAAALIGVLTLLLGFAFAVQVRNTDTDQALAGAREEDLVRILDELEAEEQRLRAQLGDQRAALRDLGDDDSQSATALEDARRRADALAILNGTVAAEGPGLIMTIRDPEGGVRVADVLDAIQELRGAGAETMQIDGVRIGVSTAVTGDPGELHVDGRPISSPYEVVVIGSPQDLETAMDIPGGVVDNVNRRGGSVMITQSDAVRVDALRPLETPQYARPVTGD